MARKKKTEAPKIRPVVNAYLWFGRTSRQGITDANPGVPFGAVSKELARRWRTMSPDEKRPFRKLEEKDRLRYHVSKVEALREEGRAPEPFVWVTEDPGAMLLFAAATSGDEANLEVDSKVDVDSNSADTAIVVADATTLVPGGTYTVKDQDGKEADYVYLGEG